MTAAEVAETKGGALAPLSPEEEALGAAVKGTIDRSKLKLPALKVVNGVSAEAAEVPLGHFVNGLTKDDLGEEVGILVSAIYYGRFYAPKNQDSSWATRDAVAPANWPEEYKGKRFTELEDAEEGWKAAVNAGEHPWGSGPPIQTTTNFIVTLADAPEAGPLRLSMKSSDTPTAEKIVSIIAAGRMPWDNVFLITPDQRATPNGKGVYYGFEAAVAGKPSDEARQAAITWAQAFQSGVEVEEQGADDVDSRTAAKRESAAKEGGIGM